MSATKYIFVTGGVTSSLGKGIVSASLAKLLQARGLSVTIQKLDPYINVDPGTLNPYEHGECYVTEDGAETDLDLGHYERFLGVPTSQANNVTTINDENNQANNITTINDDLLNPFWLAAVPKESGVISLSWRFNNDSLRIGYNVYRTSSNDYK